MPHRFARRWLDDNTSGGTTGAPPAAVNPAPAAGAPAATPAPAPAPAGLTQADVDRIVTERLSRDRETRNRELATELQRLGIDPGTDAVAALKAAAAKRADDHKADLEKKGQTDQLLKLEREEKERLLREKDDELLRLRRERKDERKRSAILESAANAVDPSQVVKLLWDEVEFDEQSGQLYAVDAQGRRISDGKGGLVTVKDHVSGWLGRNPHHQRAASGQGANSQPGTPAPRGSGTGTTAETEVDLERFKVDVEYAVANADKVARLIKQFA